MYVAQINAIYSAATKLPSQERYEYISRHLDKLIVNRMNLDAATRPAGKSGNQASHKEDVLICVRLMRTTLGDTYAKLIAPKNVSDLAGGLPLTEAKLAWVANFAHRPKLQTWVNGIVDRGEMYEQPEEPPAEDVIHLDGEDEGGEGEEEDEEDEVAPWMLAIDDAAKEKEDARVKVKRQAEMFVKHVKPYPGEDAPTFIDRVLVMIARGSEARASRSKSKKASEAKGSEDAEMDRDMIVAVAHQQYAAETGHKERRPNKIIATDATDSGITIFKCRWTDPGKHPYLRDEWKTRDWCLQFDGLLDNYERVCAAHTPIHPITHTAHTHIEPPRYHLHAHTLNSNR